MDFDEEEAPTEARNGPKKRFRKNKLKLVFDREERQKFLLGFRKRKQERKEKYIEKLERDLAKEKKRIKQQTQRKAKKLSSSHSVLPEVQSLIDNMPEKEETYDLGNTLVSITSLDDQIYRNLPTIKEEDEEDEASEEETKPSNRSLKKWSNKSGLNLWNNNGDASENEDEAMQKIKSDPFFNPINDEELSRSDLSSEEEANYDPLAMLRKNTESSDTPEDSKGLTKAKLERQANRLLQNSEVFKKVLKIKQKRSKKFRLNRLKSAAEEEESAGKKSGKPVVEGRGKVKKGKKLLGKFNRGSKRK